MTEYELWTQVPKYIQARTCPNKLVQDLSDLNAIELIKIKGVSKCKIKSERLLNAYYQSFYSDCYFSRAKRQTAKATTAVLQFWARCRKQWTIPAAR